MRWESSSLRYEHRHYVLNLFGSGVRACHPYFRSFANQFAALRRALHWYIMSCSDFSNDFFPTGKGQVTIGACRSQPSFEDGSLAASLPPSPAAASKVGFKTG